MWKKSLAIMLGGVMTMSMFATGFVCSAEEETDTAEAAEEATAESADIEFETEDDSADVPEAAQASFEKLNEAEKTLVTTDGHQMMAPGLSFDIPEVDGDSEYCETLDETDPDHWHYYEYLDWDTSEDADFPESPADGQEGKSVILIVHGAHAWTTCYSEAFQDCCDAVGMDLTIYDPNWDQATQDSYIDQAINEQPDAIALIPVSADHATQQFKKITDAGIAAFCVNTLPEADAMNYILAYTGPNDWYQMRVLADMLGEALEGEGGVAYITHNVGTSPYYARCYGPMTELAVNYPDIETLDIQSPGFEAADVKQVVSDWITKYGDDLNAIVLADDSDQAIGATEACTAAGRDDIIIVAAGISQQGFDLINDGSLYGESYQTCQGDAGLAVRTISEWFCGLPINRVNYLSTDIITADNISDFEPTQW